MNIYLINLARRPDRLMEMRRQLLELNLDFLRVDAIDGRAVQNENRLFSRRRFFLENRGRVVAGEIGCALSHILIWKRIVCEQVPYALILEDDLVLSKDLPALLASNIYRNFDFLKLDVNLDRDSVRAAGSLFKGRCSTIESHDETVRILRVRNDGPFVAYECDPVPFAMGSYIISLRGAKKFLKRARSLYFPIDLLPRFAVGMIRQGFTVMPFAPILITDSDIHGRSNGERFSVGDRCLLPFHKIFSSRRLRVLEVFLRGLWFSRDGRL